MTWKPYYMATDRPACANCRFADHDGTGHLNCLRHAPSAHIDSGGISTRKFPRMDYGEWCGDHEPDPKDPSHEI